MRALEVVGLSLYVDTNSEREMGEGKSSSLTSSQHQNFVG